MDALKKAEEAKRNSAAPGEAPAGELSLEPVVPPTGGGSPLPALDDHIATVNADLEAVAASAPKAPPQPKAPPPGTKLPAAKVAEQADVERQAARNVFTAKLAAAEEARPGRTGLWLALGGLTLALAGIGGYFWYQLQGLNQNAMMRTAPPPTAAAPLPPAKLPAVIPPPAPLPPPEAEAPQAAPTPAKAAALAERQPAPAADELAPPSPIRLTRGKLVVNPTLERAYAALQQDNLAAAAQDYEKVLQSDPRNIDALLGLASIAEREGQRAQAEGLYVRTLEADPKNAVAIAGLASLLGNGDPVTVESRLKNLLASQPEAPHLYFALGNVYVRQSRWNEAQQAFFKAMTGDADNPDYLFNLAVSLDHLNQARPAAQYYQAALTAAAQRPAAFDKEGLRRRLQELAAP